MTCTHCARASAYVGIGTNGRLTFEMWMCPFCGDASIGHKTFQPIAPDYDKLTIEDCFRAARLDATKHTRMLGFPNDA